MSQPHIADQTAAAPRRRHPLEPLTAHEIAAAAQIVRASRPTGERLRFIDVSLREPEKAQLELHERGGLVGRTAALCVIDPAERATYEALVSLDEGALLKWRHVPDGQPPLALDEQIAGEAIVKDHPAVQAALRRRGIANLDHVYIASLGAGNFGFADEKGRRLLLVIAFLDEGDGDCYHARPINGLNIYVDLHSLEVVKVEDTDVIPIPPRTPGYRELAAAATRADLHPLEIAQPEGPSFTLDGWELRWQKWHIRLGFTPREALVVHTVGYEDQGRVRSILHRASVAELVVPYGDPSNSFFRRHPFDLGEVGLGFCTNSLELGCDCLGEIRYLDAVIHDSRGAPKTIRNAICIHEEDFGVLWKHTEPSGESHVRRSRRLVVSCFTTLGNYDYGFYWYFYQDGAIQLEVKLTGIVNVTAVTPGEQTPYGTLILPQVSGVHHQHFFNIRLDMSVDGERNTVHEVEGATLPLGPENPWGNAYAVRETPLLTEREAQRLCDPLAGRYWKIANPHMRNRMGAPVAYKLLPGENVTPLAHPDSSIVRRAGFMRHHLWVTPYAPGERYPTGDYPNQHAGGAGLPAWTEADRSVEDTDLVLWYSFGCTHVVRLEDWPVMPVAYAGFSLKPAGFFDYNPSIDVPAPARPCHHHTTAS